MKREFLQNFKVGDQPLPKEIIDAIMAENGRDIEEAKKPFGDYDTIKQQLDEAQKTLKGIQDQGTDLETARKNAQDWEKKYNDAVAAHQQELANRDFNQRMESAITGAKGKSVKAILGELGPEKIKSLKESKNQEADIKAALESLQKDSGYLFNTEGTPPPYSAGAGAGGFGKQGAGDFNFGFTGIRARETGK